MSATRRPIGRLGQLRLDTLADRAAKAIADQGQHAVVAVLADERQIVLTPFHEMHAHRGLEVLGTYCMAELQPPRLSRLAGLLFNDMGEYARQRGYAVRGA